LGVDQSQAAARLTVQAGDTIQVLIIEDDENDVILVERALRKSGLAVALTRACSAASVTATMAASAFDIVLCDYAVPGLNVDTVLELVNVIEEVCPVVLLTGAVGEEAVAGLMRLGLADVVLKARIDTRLGPVVLREVTRHRERAVHHRFQERIRHLLSGFDAGQDWHQALEISLEHIAESLGASLAVMWQASTIGTALHPIASFSAAASHPDPAARASRINLGYDAVQDCIARNRTLVIPDHEAAPEALNFQPIADDVRGLGFSRLICQPLRLGDTNFGLSVLFESSPNDLDKATADIALTSKVLQPTLFRKLLEYQRNMLRSALDGVRNGVLITDAAVAPPGPRITYANRAMTNIAGYEQTEMIGRTPRIFHGPNTDHATLDLVRAALLAAEPISVELTNYKKDGTPILVELDITPVRDQGRLTHFMSIQRDVTRSRQFERERREREEAFRAVSRQAAAELQAAKDRAEQAEILLRDAIDSMSEGFAIFDQHDRFLMCNDAYRRMLGNWVVPVAGVTTFEDVVRAKWATLADDPADADVSETSGFRQRLRHHSDAMGTVEYQLRDGTWILGTDRKMQNGCTACLRVDITPLKQAQTALIESQQRFQQVADGISEVFWIYDPGKAELIFVNKAYEKVWGRSRDSLYTELSSAIDTIHPDDREAVRNATSRLPDAGGQTVEYRVIRPDGTLRWIHQSSTAITNSAGVATLIAGVCKDITAQREFESRSRQAQKMEAVGVLVGGMAHDFNNVLGVIMGSLDLLKRRVAGDRMARELCDDALGGAKRGADLIKSLLAFARRQSLRPIPIDVNALIGNMMALLRRALGEDIVLSAALDPALWVVMADPVQLETALLNFASNARDAMPRGGRLDIATCNTRLDQGHAPFPPDVMPGEYVLIEIADTGTGIAPDTIGRIFEPFFTTKMPGKGTGLGLAMIYGFVKQSDGHLSVQSEPGKGTKFRLYLPREAERRPQAVPAIAPTAVIGGNESILLVEDNAQLRQTVAAQIADLGYQLHVAEDAEAALAIMARERRLDLMFTDVVMAGAMDGIALAEQAQLLRPGLKVLLTSGFPDVRDASRRIAGGSLKILDKPYSRGELARALRCLLDAEVSRPPQTPRLL
jgi:PAS domain S-box-containing protein